MIGRDWLAGLGNRIAKFMHTLQAPDQPGRFLPCLGGASREGKEIALGFSCFALKIYYTLGIWKNLSSEEQKAWIGFLKSFQLENNPDDRLMQNAFIDPPVWRYLTSQMPWRRRFLERFTSSRKLTTLQRVIIAETKQTIATLAQVGAGPTHPYRGFPLNPMSLRDHLLRLNWKKPWGAGGHAAALVVFLRTQGPMLLGDSELESLLDICTRLFEDMCDSRTGAYFKADRAPGRGQMINGAMKVLTALDWLDVPVHYPEKLIDTCLESLPSAEGCHLVDVVYVLYQCSRQTQHRKAQMRAYCAQVLEMIERHHNPDGGFSYFVGKTQTHYYDVPISRGLSESDIHGTCLLTWALAMIFEMLDLGSFEWKVIRP